MPGFSDDLETRVLNSTLRAVAWVAVPGVALSLHTADPGDTGASEVTGGSYARQVAAYNAPSGGACALTAPETFAGMPACTVTHFGIWSTDATPVFLYSGPVTPNKTLAAGDELRLDTGTVTLS